MVKTSMNIINYFNSHLITTSTTKDVMSEDFWKWFDAQNSCSHSSSEKCLTLKKCLCETLNHLNPKDTVLSDSISIQDKMLVFVPGNINPKEIENDQIACFNTMYNEYARNNAYANIIIDLTNLTWSKYMSIIFNASKRNIIDGIRLWACLPCRVETVVIKRSKHMSIPLIYLLIRLLSHKIQERIVIE